MAAVSSIVEDIPTNEKRGEKRPATDDIPAAAIATTTTATDGATPSSSVHMISSSRSNGEKKDEVKQPNAKKAKKKKKGSTNGSSSVNDGTDGKPMLGGDDDDQSEAGKKARGLAKSQRANRLALGIPDQPPGLEIFNLVRPVNIPAAFEFFKSIGAPKYVVAPMVNQSELAFRLLTRRYGATLCYTPMMHAKLFGKSAKYRSEQFQTTAADRPLFAQFCANDPAHLLEAARHLEGKCDAVDINFGCPQGIARRGNYGSFLLNRPQILRALVTVLHNYLNLPVTVKIRILPNLDDTIKMAKMLEACGARLITVHGRTKEMLKDRTGPNDFAVIARLKKELSVPVISNGGIETYDDVQTTLKVTGADGIMTSEGILGNPAIFAGTDVPSPIRISREYLSLAREYPADSSAVRAHLIKFLFRELAIHTDIRQQIAEHKDPVNCDALLDEIERRNAALPTGEYEAAMAKIPTWYRRFNPLPGQIRTRDFDKEGGLKDEKSGTSSSTTSVTPSAAVLQLQRDRAAKKAVKKQKKKEAAAIRSERLASREGMTTKQWEQSQRMQKNARKDAQRRQTEAKKVMAAATAALAAAVSTGTIAPVAASPTTSSSPLPPVPVPVPVPVPSAVAATTPSFVV